MKFSAEQEKIIFAGLDNNLVSASAGSGKTTVLTARIGEEVKTGKLSVDKMLVVTFTEDAASHMADKIEEKLRSLRNDAVSAGDYDLAARLYPDNTRFLFTCYQGERLCLGRRTDG